MNASFTSTVSAVAASQRSWRDKIRLYDSLQRDSAPSVNSSGSQARRATTTAANESVIGLSTPRRGGRFEGKGDTSRVLDGARRYGTSASRLDDSYQSHGSSPSSSSAPSFAGVGQYQRRFCRSPRREQQQQHRANESTSGGRSNSSSAQLLAAKYPKYFARRGSRGQRDEQSLSAFLFTSSPPPPPLRSTLSSASSLRLREARRGDADASGPVTSSDRSSRSPSGPPRRLIISPKRQGSTTTNTNTTSNSNSSSSSMSGPPVQGGSSEDGRRSSTNSPAASARKRRERQRRTLLSSEKEKGETGTDSEGTSSARRTHSPPREVPPAIDLYGHEDSDDGSSARRSASPGDPLLRLERQQLAGSPLLIPEKRPRLTKASRSYSNDAAVPPPPSQGHAGWLGRFLEEMVIASRRSRRASSKSGASPDSTQHGREGEAAAHRERDARLGEEEDDGSIPPPLTGSESSHLEHLHVLALEQQLDAWRRRAFDAETAATTVKEEARRERVATARAQAQEAKSESTTEALVRELLAPQQRLQQELVDAIAAKQEALSSHQPEQGQRQAASTAAASPSSAVASNSSAVAGPGEKHHFHSATGALNSARQGLSPSLGLFPQEAPSPVLAAAAARSTDGGARASSLEGEPETAEEEELLPGPTAAAGTMRPSVASARSLFSTRAGSPSALSSAHISSSSPPPLPSPLPVPAPPHIGRANQEQQQQPQGKASEDAPPPLTRRESTRHSRDDRDPSPPPDALPEKAEAPPAVARENAEEETEGAASLISQLTGMQGELSVARECIAELKQALVRTRQQQSQERQEQAEKRASAGPRVAQQQSPPSLPAVVEKPTPVFDRHTQTSPLTPPPAPPRAWEAPPSHEMSTEPPNPSIASPIDKPCRQHGATAVEDALARDHLASLVETAYAAERANAELRRRIQSQDATLHALELEKLEQTVMARKQQRLHELSSLADLNTTPTPSSFSSPSALLRSEGTARDASFLLRKSGDGGSGVGGHERRSRMWTDVTPSAMGVSRGVRQAILQRRELQEAESQEEAPSRYAASGAVFELSRQEDSQLEHHPDAWHGRRPWGASSSPFRGVYQAKDHSLVLQQPVMHAPRSPSSPSCAPYTVPQPSRMQVVPPDTTTPGRASAARDIANAIHQRSTRFLSPIAKRGTGTTAAAPGGRHHAVTDARAEEEEERPGYHGARLPASRESVQSNSPSSSALQQQQRREKSGVSSFSDPAWNSIRSFEDKFNFLL